jgi:hypothetical protein
MSIEEQILRALGWNPTPEKLARFHEACRRNRERQIEDEKTEADYVSREHRRRQDFRRWRLRARRGCKK